MLYAYFDESYNHRTVKCPTDPLIYTVACWLAPLAQWKKFSKQWKSALRSVGLADFHMKEYESRIGPYADWTIARRIGFIKRLHRIIKDHVVYGCAYSLDREAFEALVTPDVRRKFVVKTCYGFNAFSCMDDINRWCHLHDYPGPIQYVFAQLNKQGGDLDQMFAFANKFPQVKEALRMNGTWVKGFAKDVVQLQAADIVAYEVNKQIVNVASGGEREIRKSLQNLALVTTGKFFAGYFGPAQMAHMMKDYNAGKLVSMVPNVSQHL